MARVAVASPVGGADHEVRQPAREAEGRRRWLRASVVAPLLIVCIAGGIRAWGVSSPARTYWDEAYYAIDAWAYLGGVVAMPGNVLPPAPTIHAERSWGHPPLGKWLIAAGEGPTHDSFFGMRMPSVIFGTAGVLLVYLIALELWGSVAWASLAGLLVALDGLHIVQSRIAMLDIFVSTFVCAGVLFFVRDRKRLRAAEAVTTPVPVANASRLERWFGSKDRFWAGVMFGAAVSVKWVGAWPLLLAFGLTVHAIRRAFGAGRARSSALRGAVLAFVAVPIAIYLASYAQFFAQHPVDVPGFLRLQWHMLDVQRADHHFLAKTSPAWTWPLLLHPIRYWSAVGTTTSPDQTAGSILALGNPVLFWGFLAAIPLALHRALRRTDAGLRLALGFYAVLFGPWLLMSRSQYFYYVLPCVPFMALALVGVLRELPGRAARAGGTFTAVLAATAAALFLPVWLGLPASPGRLALLHWLPGWH